MGGLCINVLFGDLQPIPLLAEPFDLTHLKKKTLAKSIHLKEQNKLLVATISGQMGWVTRWVELVLIDPPTLFDSLMTNI